MMFKRLELVLLSTIVVIIVTGEAHLIKPSKELIVEPPRPLCKKPDKYEISWIVQFANHFTKLDPTVLRMRYYSNLDFFEQGGPMIVIIGGPWEISPHFVCGGLVVNVAKTTRAAVFYMEHRFYGQSHPAR